MQCSGKARVRLFAPCRGLVLTGRGRGLGARHDRRSGGREGTLSFFPGFRVALSRVIDWLAAMPVPALPFVPAGLRPP